MTTAARPTFDPATGKEARRGPAYHQRLLPAHKTLKFRQANQGTEDENARRDLRAELLRKERRHYAEKDGREYNSDEDEVPRVKGAITDGRGRKRSLDETRDDGIGTEEEESYEAKKARVLAETKDVDASSSGEDSEEESEEDDDDEDEEAALMAELAKIKKERAEAAAREAAEKTKEEEEQREKDIAYGNPLLNPKSEDYGVKRRWDDDVVFKNQARGQSERDKKGKEFVNDLLRSDFHKKFMSRYVR
ncbi:hypothetical protein CAC42_7161 [Sphaceloma murrayae]|uniref:Pre-mRNA-splicing factor cwc15 n=1 Tax=Sphaceloma murrayae TaxID=2082308 RepID=A0A2K1QQX1_9PEZI|nr:hypothetical protein CAC42_7161 [Sphaceloma murrayae]